ncbi:hypothetical protein [Nocardia transvalensis]|uniref:hypothetical protein n=1 Tax=Nocardia transvalensis TaxID=37333 RepID=UPI0018951BAB|nr:hypothetical protein [Nocardia transvalensis]MBF6333743.1 hypothetical protein [Nocardia transvalensis]
MFGIHSRALTRTAAAAVCGALLLPAAFTATAHADYRPAESDSSDSETDSPLGSLESLFDSLPSDQGSGSYTMPQPDDGFALPKTDEDFTLDEEQLTELGKGLGALAYGFLSTFQSPTPGE